MVDTSDAARPRQVGTFLRIEWQELGPIGRTVLVALGMFLVVAVALAVAIPRQIEAHLIDGHIRSLTRVVDDLDAEGMIPTGSDDALVELDTAVRRHLLGADVVRVKVWLPDGTVAYADEPALIGRSFERSADLDAAFAGVPISDVPELERPENVFERDLPPLREFYIPVDGPTGTKAVFEVYHLAEPIESTVADIRTYVWISLLGGIGLLAAFVATLIVINGRAVTRRQRLAEDLLADLVTAQARERTRIIGSLHDDIGQSLYRIHYGIEDLRTKIPPDDPASQELTHLSTLVADVEGSLRAELRSLFQEDGNELSLGFELDELAEVTEMESDLAVDVRLDGSPRIELLDPAGRALLVRAAREAITNVRKHAQASKVKIVVRGTADRVSLEVSDDGIGISGDEGLGIVTTRRRLESSGGGLVVERGRSGGTRFEAWLPPAECGAGT